MGSAGKENRRLNFSAAFSWRWFKTCSRDAGRCPALVDVSLSFGLTKTIFNRYCYCWKWGVRGVLKTKKFVNNVMIKGRVNLRPF